MLFSRLYQKRSYRFRGGLTYHVGALALPADSLYDLVADDLDALLLAAIGTEPRRALIFDCFIRDGRVVTHLMPA